MTPIPKPVIIAARTLVVVTVAAVTALSLIPGLPGGPEGSDKLRHFLAYAVLSCLAVFSIRYPRHLVSRAILVIVAASAYGVMMEFAQRLVGRNFDVMDMVANAAGATFGGGIGAFLRRAVSALLAPRVACDRMDENKERRTP